MISIFKRSNSKERDSLGLNIKPSRKNSISITISNLKSNGDNENISKETQIYIQIGQAIKITLRTYASIAKQAYLQRPYQRQQK